MYVKGHLKVQKPVPLCPAVVKMFGRWSMEWVGKRPLDLLAQGTGDTERREDLPEVTQQLQTRESSSVQALNSKFPPLFDCLSA